MALNYDIVTSTDSADIVIHNIYNLGVQNLTLQVFINNGFVEWVDVDTTWITDYTYTYEGLSPNTTYRFQIDFWDYRTVVDSISGNFTTKSGGGGGGQPRFIAYATNNNSDIYVNAYDLWTVNYDYVDYEISSGSYTDSYRAQSSGSHTFEGVPAGTYTVEVWYIYNNRPYRIYTPEGDSSVTVTIGGGGGGGGWVLSASDLGILSSETSRTLSGMAGQTLYSWSFVFPTAGSVTFSSSGSADTIGWLSGYNQTSWDSSAGRPEDYLAYNDDGRSGRNFEITYQCDANTVYYLWFRTYSGDAYSDSVTITISPAATPATWRYEEVSGYSNISAQTLKSVTMASGVGQYFTVSFASGGTATVSVPSGANLNLFVTDGNYGYDTSDGFPYVYSGGKAASSLTQSFSVTSGATFYVWVKGSTTSITGGISVTITPPSGQTWTYTLATSITNPSSIVTRNYTLQPGNGYYMAVRFQTAGTAVFYTEGSNLDDIGYLTSSNSGYDSSNGTPYNIVAQNDDGGTGNNFRIEYSVTANTTYYLWFRMFRTTGSGSITLYVVPPSAQTGGYVYIYTGSAWVRAKPYIYTGSAWVPATPYIYTGSTWKPTT